MKKISTTTSVLRVQSPIDQEGMAANPIILNVNTKDGGGLTHTATVTITVNNVNDNRPTFTQTLYNFEMMCNDTKGHVVGSISCTDKDVAYNQPSYQWLDDQIKYNFTVHSSTGAVSSALTPLIAEYEYVLFAECRDNHPGHQMISLTQVVRVDTYYGWNVLTNWTTSQSSAYYDINAYLEYFLTGASALCKPCVAKLHSRHTNSDGRAVLVLYFLKDSSTDSIGNIGKKKEYITATDIMGAYTTDKVETPASSVTGSSILSTHGIISIVRYKDAPVQFNWMLDTIGGHIFIGLCMSLALALGLTTVICIARYTCGSTTKGSPPKSTKHLHPESYDVDTFNFNYAAHEKGPL